MAAGVNKAILIGHLGRDPEMRYTTEGLAIANFTLATTEVFGKKGGERENRTEWHRIVAFGRLGEICGEYLSKGRQVYIEGRIQTREWEDKEGTKRYTTEIVASTMQMLGSKDSNAGSSMGSSNYSKPQQAKPQGSSYNNSPDNSYSSPEPSYATDMPEDDIPF